MKSETVITGTLIALNIIWIGSAIKSIYDLCGPEDAKSGEKMQSLIKRVKQDIVPSSN